MIGDLLHQRRLLERAAAGTRLRKRTYCIDHNSGDDAFQHSIRYLHYRNRNHEATLCSWGKSGRKWSLSLACHGYGVHLPAIDTVSAAGLRWTEHFCAASAFGAVYRLSYWDDPYVAVLYRFEILSMVDGPFSSRPSDLLSIGWE